MSEVSVYEAHKEKMELLIGAIRESVDSEEYGEANLEPNHYYAHGTYTRELFLPAGSFYVTKIHRYDCIAIILYGRCNVVTDKGDYELVGPKVLITDKGSKGIQVIEDTLWVTVHPWDGQQTIEELEDYVIAPSYAALEMEQQENIE